MTNPSNDIYTPRPMDEIVRGDHLWLNNPVVMQGLGLAPIVVADTNAQNALLLMLAVAMLLTLTRVISVALLHLTGNHLRAVIYCYVAALLYIPCYLLLYEFIPDRMLSLGIYLPLLVVDPLIIIRCERKKMETLTLALRRGVQTTAGACIVIFAVGCLRELLASGTVLGYHVMNTVLFPQAGTPAGGFILLGIFCAVWRGFANRYKAVLGMGVKR